MKRPLLLDLDLDFLWNRDCYYLNEEAEVAYSPEEVGQSLYRLKKRGTKVHLIVDHQEALFIWDKLNIKEACCVHIDAHHDMWLYERCLETRSKGIRGSTVGCGSYLGQAIVDDIVREVIYVAPKFKYVCDEEHDIKVEFGSLQNITIMKWRNFVRTMHLLPKADVITIALSPEWSPVEFWPEMKTVCEILGVSKNSLRCRKKQANEKWKIIEREGTSSAFRLDFCFPYKSLDKK